MIAENLPALQVIVPLFGALIAALVRRGNIAWLVTLVTSFATPLIAFALLTQVLRDGPISYALGDWAPPIGIEYRIDVVNAYVLVLVSLIAAVILPYARASVALEIREERRAWFYTMYLLCLTGLAGITITGDAFNAFVFLEVSSLSTYTMIALGRDRRALIAAYQYLIMGTIGATFYVIGVGLLYVMTGTLNLVDLSTRLVEVESTRTVFAALAFIVVGISLKLALFPLHVWLPNAYAYAPSVATAFLAATATKVAVYLLLRFVFSVFGARFVFGETALAPMLVLLSVAAMFGASIVAAFQDNLKRMLAYSSVAQIGYVTLGIALATTTGLTGGIVHLFNHAVTKGALFLVLGIVFYCAATVKVEDLAGLGRRMPVTMAAFVIAGLSLIGVPGTAGFISKWYLVAAALEKGWWWLAFLIVASSVIAVIYVGRVVEILWFRTPTTTVAEARRPSPVMVAVAWLMVAATVYFGIDTNLTAAIASRAAETLLVGGAQ
ncbi:MAG: monovalent cation/H+ antiporter subunit D family protein [Hyphomicrobiales bacterium]|nr:monovalent cation/H+ antiporter subunit D family protein [Hyphomicrobiales bacterium]